MFGFGKGGEKPQPPIVKETAEAIPGTSNYLGAEPASKFGPEATYMDKGQFVPKEVVLTPPDETPAPISKDTEEPLVEPKNYLGAPGFGDKPERPEDEDFLKEKAESERKAKIAEIKRRLLELLQSDQENITIVTNLTAGDGKNITITLENIKTIS